MPLYEYKCDACGRHFEVIQKFSDPAVDACRECGKGPVHRLPSSPAIQFKGSGWYITDYAKKGSGESSTSGDKTAGSKANGTGDTKTESATGDTAKSDSSTKSDTAATSSKSKP